MSEWSMMTGPQNWKIAYPAFLLLMGMLGIGNYLLLKRLDARDRVRADKNLRNWADKQRAIPPAG